MILKNFDTYDDYSEYSNGIINGIENYQGEHDGYFQNHTIGLILFAFKNDNFLRIGNKEYDIPSISKINYSADGIQREVQFVDNSEHVIDEFNYTVFWDNEVDMLEFAMELPDDVQRDLMKFISNKISSQ